ncbi:MAG: hypothetical protein ACRC62_39800 [Microcoleus sp.]
MNCKSISTILLLTIALCELTLTPAKARGTTAAGTVKVETLMTNMIPQRICKDKYGNEYSCP